MLIQFYFQIGQRDQIKYDVFNDYNKCLYDVTVAYMAAVEPPLYSYGRSTYTCVFLLTDTIVNGYEHIFYDDRLA